ncbi:MAG TPA: hypothetical protein VGN77_06535, partial [Steroidobacteraceae bacterium]|nr:hypothetical protein [Steroidobacteraceae bacterium]
SNNSLTSAGILTLWGAASGFQPKTVLALGRLSGADPGSGTINLLLDSVVQASATFGQTLNGGIYAVRTTDGRTTVTFTAGATTRSFVLYLDGSASGYAVEPTSTAGSAGLLEAQSAGPFDANAPGLFVSGTQFPEDDSPMLLLPSVHFTSSSFAANFATGYYTVNPITGRAVGTINVSGAPVTAFAFYIVRPDKVVTLQGGSPYLNGVISWYNSD